MASNGGISPHVNAALTWAKLQAGEWDRLRRESQEASAVNYYEQAIRHLRTLIEEAERV